MKTSVHRFMQTRRLAGVICVLILGLTVGSCGRKTFPRPESTDAQPQVRDLQVQVRAKGVELTWTIPPQMRKISKENPYRFNILRSELLWENRNCLDCPAAVQRELQMIDPVYPDPALAHDGKLSWTDPAVSVQHAYRYQIVIQDKDGRPVTMSNTAIAKVFHPPGQIKSLSATPGPQGILVQWKPPARDNQGQPLQGELLFAVERLSATKVWERISSAPIKANNYLDQGIAADRMYGYRVTPVLYFEDTAIVGDPALTHQVKAPEALPPPPPANVWVIPSKGTLEVQWTESTEKVAGYHVYRREGKEMVRLTANPIQHPPYIDHTAKPNTVYFYAVSSVSSQHDNREGLLSKWAEIRSLMFEK
ncbi:MAG TPA: hypothetical protein PK250_01815 [Syntrophobacter fumaroxidans]|nr:hypothetical protein [Syntrophobacter fumaroxidans]